MSSFPSQMPGQMPDGTSIESRRSILNDLLLEIPREPLVNALHQCGFSSLANASAKVACQRLCEFLLDPGPSLAMRSAAACDSAGEAQTSEGNSHKRDRVSSSQATSRATASAHEDDEDLLVQEVDETTPSWRRLQRGSSTQSAKSPIAAAGRAYRMGSSTAIDVDEDEGSADENEANHAPGSELVGTSIEVYFKNPVVGWFAGLVSAFDARRNKHQISYDMTEWHREHGMRKEVMWHCLATTKWRRQPRVEQTGASSRGEASSSTTGCARAADRPTSARAARLTTHGSRKRSKARPQSDDDASGSDGGSGSDDSGSGSEEDEVWESSGEGGSDSGGSSNDEDESDDANGSDDEGGMGRAWGLKKCKRYVGRRVSVYWTDDRKWYEGSVIGVQAR